MQLGSKRIAAVAEHAERPNFLGKHRLGNVDNLTFGDRPDALRHAVIVIDHAVEEITAGVAGGRATDSLGAALETAQGVLLMRF